MIRIGIFTCSNATRNLDCCSESCLDDLRNRRAAFAVYPKGETLELVDIAHCPGCPTAVGLEKPLRRIRALAEFKVETIHLSSCFLALCPFKKRFLDVLETEFPGIEIVSGTHGEHNSNIEFWTELKNIYVNLQAETINAAESGGTT